MKKISYLLLLLTPQTSQASGDPGVLIWTGTMVLLHIATCLFLILSAVKGRKKYWDVALFVAISIAGWSLYLNTTMKWMWPQLAAMALFSLGFIINSLISNKLFR